MHFELIYQAKRYYHFFKTGLLKGLTAEIKYRFPARKLKIITITGTDGKTTSCTLLYHVLRQAGKKVALISTVGALIDDEMIDTGFHVTSPEPDQVHKFLKQMVDRGIEYVVLEVTSHGAYQYRTWGIHPLIAGITNITHEHLDYHLNYENYVEAKSLALNAAPTIVLNVDDQSYSKLRKLINHRQHHVLTYSQEDKIYYQVDKAIKDRFSEEYNRLNARLVYTIAQELKLTNQEFIAAVASFQYVTGRMQFLDLPTPYKIVIDFAHTPNALESALVALRKTLNEQRGQGRLIAIFGCAGLRDRTKRPLMGEIGARLADLAVFTAEDPRTEDIWSIIRQMKENLDHNHHKVISIADRKAAIEFVLTKIAQKNDIIGIFGKGHEQSLCYGTIEYPYSDEAAVKEVLRLK
jgi:UDP-N-acetylmuramoyl-L-alanyl-D-glutamate--2,6-diaminopimelate ligase